MDDLSCEKLVRRLSGILSGDICASFAFAMQIPSEFVVNNLLQTKRILQKYLREKELSEGEIQELKLTTQKEIEKVNTINDMLELQIIDLLKLGYDFNDDKRSVDFDLKSTVFMSEDTAMSLEKVLLEKVITLIECYEGARCFWIHVSFNDGIGNVSIQA